LFVGKGGRLGGGVGLGLTLNGVAHLFRHVHGNRTRVSLLLRDAEARQKVDDGLGLDFELAGQLVDSDLVGVAHAFCSVHLFTKLRSRFVFLLIRGLFIRG
jgi:hypothetical protein